MDPSKRGDDRGGGGRYEVFRKPARGGTSTGGKTMTFRMGVRLTLPGRGLSGALRGVEFLAPWAWPTQSHSPSLAWVQSGGLLQADAGGPPPLQ